MPNQYAERVEPGKPKDEKRPMFQKLLLGALAAATMSDIVTTNKGLGMPGHVEYNPFLPDGRWANTAVMTAEGAGAVAALDKLWKNHPKIAAAIAAAGIGLEAHAAIGNYKRNKR